MGSRRSHKIIVWLASLSATGAQAKEVLAAVTVEGVIVCSACTEERRSVAILRESRDHRAHHVRLGQVLVLSDGLRLTVSSIEQGEVTFLQGDGRIVIAQRDPFPTANSASEPRAYQAAQNDAPTSGTYLPPPPNPEAGTQLSPEEYAERTAWATEHGVGSMLGKGDY